MIRSFRLAACVAFLATAIGTAREQAPSPSVPIVETIVNDPSRDVDNGDTQSETSIVLGSGSHVIAAFNNTRLRNNHSVGFASSPNGGAFWTDGGALPSN